MIFVASIQWIDYFICYCVAEKINGKKIVIFELRHFFITVLMMMQQENILRKWEGLQIAQ